MSPAPGALPESVGIIGAGTMGAGIALAFALAGCRDVRLMARHDSSLTRADARVDGGLERLVSQRVLEPAVARTARDALSLTMSLETVASCQLLIESIPEDLTAKLSILAIVDGMAPKDAVLTTNTSSISLETLSRVLSHPERFAGFHWLNPAELVPLVEVVSGPATDPATVTTLMGWATHAGKSPIHVKRDVPGFVVNRLQYALLREAYRLAELGVSSLEDIDTALTSGLGLRWAAVGPFQTMDLAGLDVHAAVARRLFPELSNQVAVPGLVVDLIAAGALGAKTGRGLRGAYSPERLAAVTGDRDLVLLTLARLDKSDSGRSA
jgi:3-hydroxybutyryl-CoA dehydrogenase